MFRQQAELYGSKPPTAPDLWCLPFIIKKYAEKWREVNAFYKQYS